MNYEATILLVEDNKDDIFFMERAFKTAGILNPIQIVRDGEKAIEYLSGGGTFTPRDKFPIPYLLLLDLKLPFKSGHEVLGWIRNQDHLSALIVIMLSTSGEAHDVDQAYELGANAYLVKPSSPPQLAEMMVAVKTFWLDQNVRSFSSYPGTSAV
jgi:CheY-like chemotaxis protein